MAMMMRTVEEEEHHDHHDHHDHGNQHREFSSHRGLVGPTASEDHALYDVALHNSPFHSYSTAFRIPGGESQMGFPFTSAQWKELERQAMIYKYMMASLPVPIDLLLPNLISANNASTASKLCSSAPNLKYANGKGDLEPGRCNRTDGKKWRCSRDVAPNQKYCERHMNRGRPRSRKHVEQQQHQRQRFQNLTDDTNNKKIRHSHGHGDSTSTTALPRHDVMAQAHFHGGSSTSVPNYHAYPCANTASPYGSSCRSSDWMKAEHQQAVSMAASDPRWLHLVQTKMELPQNLNEEEEEPFLNLNSYGSHSHERDCALFLYHGDDVVSDPPARSFIDAWSQTTQKTATNHETTHILKNDNMSPSSLTLSMGNRVSSETDYDETLRVCNPSCWVSPLAEVLRPSAPSEPPSPVAGISPAETTTVSSPSGVLQKTGMASLSDSSNCTSPGLASASMAKPEIALL